MNGVRKAILQMDISLLPAKNGLPLMDPERKDSSKVGLLQLNRSMMTVYSRMRRLIVRTKVVCSPFPCDSFFNPVLLSRLGGSLPVADS